MALTDPGKKRQRIDRGYDEKNILWLWPSQKKNSKFGDFGTLSEILKAQGQLERLKIP